MSQTFDIRFARSAGLAALFEAPSNSFRWKGNGRLLVEPHGLGIAFERMLLGFRFRTERLSVDGTTEVYREGDALRFEFARQGAKREVLPIWARDRAAAAEIVRLMPTRRTVEIEDAPATTGGFRPDLRMFALLAILMILVAVGVLQMRGGSSISPAIVVKPAEALSATPAAAGPTTEPVASSPEPLVRESSEPARIDVAPPVPMDQYRAVQNSDSGGTHGSATQSIVGAADPQAAAAARAAEETARAQAARAQRQHELDLFMIEADSLRLAYKDLFTDAAPPKLRELEDRWSQLSQRIYDGSLPSTEPMRTQELVISQSWRRALSMRASRQYSAAQVKEEIEFATMLTEQVKNSVD